MPTRPSYVQTRPSYESQTVAQWLTSLGQSDRIRTWLWNPLALAALNQSPDLAGADAFIAVLRQLFGRDPEASAIGLPCVPLDDLYAEPAARFVEQHGGVVIRRQSARVELDSFGAVAGVRAGDTLIAAPIVISAVPWHSVGRLWPGAPPPAIAPVVEAAGRMGGEPIVTANLWFDRPVLPARFVGLAGARTHWLFDRQAIVPGGGRYIAAVTSGATDILRLDNDAIAAIAERDVRAVSPVGRDARLIRSLVVREPQATFSLAPGGPLRPGVRTPIPGFFLAGDWVDTGLPGTIEGAVLGGHRAADAALQ